MARKYNKHSLLCFLLLQLSFPTSCIATDDDTFPDQVSFTRPLQPYECPYPCLPPPVAPTTICSSPPPTPSTPPSPPPPLQPASNYYPPPQSGWFNPPPAGDFPFYDPPEHPNYYGAPPPPNPILPYFPFYYKNPPPPVDFSSSAKLDPRIACCICIVAQALGFYIVK